MNMYRLLLILMALSVGSFGAGCGDDSSDDDGSVAGSAAAGTGGAGTGSAGTAAAGTAAAGTAAAGMGEAGMGEAGTGSAGMGEAGTGAGTGGEPEPMDIIDTAVAAGSFTQLAEALTSADLIDALKGEGPFTVFAPSDDAFEAFEAANPGVLESLSVEELTGILTYHVVAGGAVMSGDLMDGQLVESLAGPVLAVDLSGSAPMINEASVVTADLEATNGVIHVIDTIILPPGDIIDVATAAGDFTSLAGALTDAGLVDTLKGEGPFTVFAPTDAAFAALSAVPTGDALVEVLTYHVLSGIAGPLDLVDGGAAVTVAGSPVLFDLSSGAAVVGGQDSMAMITTTNVVASNGVIHVIDAVILPPASDIVDTAVAAGFDQLAGALTSQGLVDTLKGDGPFTVFAPTDDAFAALPSVPSGDALTDVLLYHVVDGAIASGNLVDGDVEMKSGASVAIDLSDGAKGNDSNGTPATVLATNGSIHIVDAVLIPPSP